MFFLIFTVLPHTNVCIDGLQSLARESNDKDVAAMLDELTIEGKHLLLSSSNMAAMTSHDGGIKSAGGSNLRGIKSVGR